MLIFTDSIWEPLSVLMFTVLTSVPLLPARFTFMPIWPLPPDSIFQGKGGNCAVVQPQDGWTFNIVTLDEETLVKLNLKFAVLSPATTLVIFVTLSHTMVALETAVLNGEPGTDRVTTGFSAGSPGKEPTMPAKPAKAQKRNRFIFISTFTHFIHQIAVKPRAMFLRPFGPAKVTLI